MTPEKSPWYSHLFLFILCLQSLANGQSLTLQYNAFAMVNWNGEPLSSSVCVYLNGESFLCYDSKSQTLEPQGTWLDSIMKTDIGDLERRNLKEIVQDFRIILRKVMEQSNQNTDSHTFQEILGCELHKDGSTRGFLRFGYDGEDFLIFHSETSTWEAVHPGAQSLKNAFEAEPKETKIQKAKVDGDCCHHLQKYLEVWKKKKAVFPSLYLTQSKNSKGNTILMCWAYNFFPRDITVTLYRDGCALSQREQEGGVIQPSGDGTYQTWVSINVYREGSNYTCHVEHEGRNQTNSVYLGPVSEANRTYGISAALILGFSLLLLCL